MKKILIINANFYPQISEMLVSGATEEIKKSNFNYDIIEVSGALEIPTVISIAKDTNIYEGFVAIGCVIRGETTHYDYVCQISANSLNDLAVNHKLAIGNGIITCENKDQAISRADQKQKNKNI